MTTFAVLDVGGTAIKLGAVRGRQVLVGHAVPAHAHRDADHVLGRLRTALDEALACAHRLADEHDDTVDGIAVDFPSPFDFDRATPLIRGLNKYDAIYGIDLRNELSTGHGLPIEFVRDSEAVGVGEAVFGAGQRYGRVLTIALGTGMGSCLTDGGRPLYEVDGVVIDRLHERVTDRGTADDVFSSRGLAAALDLEPDELPIALTPASISRAQRAAVEDFGRRLGQFLADTAELGRDAVVIAGGISETFELFGPALRVALDVPCVPAQLGARAALLGAARLAFPGHTPANS